MDEKQIEKIAQELSEKDLNDLAAGKPLSSKAKKVLKYVGIGVVSAAAAASTGVGIAALVGWKTGRGAFGYLHSGKENINSNSLTSTSTSNSVTSTSSSASSSDSKEYDPLLASWGDQIQ